jgi:hypothetical protein
MTKLTAERLREVLSYYPETGIFAWRVNTNRVRVAQVAGNLNPRGYRRIKINGRDYKAHRLAWLYMTGEWPPTEIDHINCDRDDNRWANLRTATRGQNARNARRPAHNSSGLKGASWHAGDKKWRAQIRVDGRTKHLGQFDNPIDAHKAYVAAAEEHSGKFARAE